MIPVRLLYGSYPEIVLNQGQEKDRLKLLTESYLYKDILMYEGLKKPDKLVHLLKLLAFRIGTEVNYLCASLQADDSILWGNNDSFSFVKAVFFNGFEFGLQVLLKRSVHGAKIQRAFQMTNLRQVAEGF